MSSTKHINGGDASTNHETQTRTRTRGCLRVVLLCKGKGADKDSYRPRSDESQWWGRRDALVRCVSSFLFGAEPDRGGAGSAGAGAGHNAAQKELVLLFDEDLARLHMTLVDDGAAEGNNSNHNTRDHGHGHGHGHGFPKEETVVQLWKRAAQNLRTPVSHQGMKCVIHLDPSLSPNPQTTPSKTSRGSDSKGGGSIDTIDTKRAVLEFIQKNVSVEFLREHRLNSNPDVVLRKTNRKSLLKVWDTWTKQQQSGGSSSPSPRAGDGGESDTRDDAVTRRLTRIYRDLLRFSDAQTDPSRNESSTSIPPAPMVVAGTLHETCDEFPCFGPKHTAADASKDYHACFFLGAVRDMTSHEHHVLERVCKTSGIPLVGVRFGTVPEFTSKILSLLSFHHANGVLGGALTRLLAAESSPRASLAAKEPQPQLRSTCLNVVCTVPASSRAITIDIQKRDEIHWRLVRVIVCSLWRSKLASSGSNVRHTNSLRLVFDDGIVACLEERRFVEELASQHQAAPSEYQILAALVRAIDRQSSSSSSSSPSSQTQAPPVSSSSKKRGSSNGEEESGGGDWSRKKLAKRLVRDVAESSPIPLACAIGIESESKSKSKSDSTTRDENDDDLVTRFYHNPSSDASEDRGLLLIASIAPPSGGSAAVFGRRRPRREIASETSMSMPKPTPKPPPRIYRELLSAARKRNLPTLEQRLVNRCTDREAASIVVLQHVCYQNRAFVAGASRDSSTSSIGPTTAATTTTTTKLSGEKRKRTKPSS